MQDIHVPTWSAQYMDVTRRRLAQMVPQCPQDRHSGKTRRWKNPIVPTAYMYESDRLDGLGSGYRSSGAPSTFVSALQKQAPTMAVDKQGRILVNGPNFEHYMAMIPLLARQFDDLPGGDPTGGTCLARVLRYSQQNPDLCRPGPGYAESSAVRCQQGPV